MNTLKFNNQIVNLITDFIAYIPTIGEFDPNNERPNKDFHSNPRTCKPKLHIAPK